MVSTVGKAAPIAFLLAASAAASSAQIAGVTPDEHSPISSCKHSTLPKPIEQLVRPVLIARARQIQHGRHFDPPYEAAFQDLLESKDPNALEAQVALMAYYVGEHPGEELLEAVLARGRKADALVSQYKVCRPRLSFEDELSGVVVLETLYRHYEAERRRNHPALLPGPLDDIDRQTSARTAGTGV